MIILKWIASIVVFTVLTTLFLFVSQLYFNWLVPLESAKDWIIAFLMLPISVIVFFSPMFGYVAGAALLPQNRTGAAYTVFIIISILNLAASFNMWGSPSTFAAKLNLVQDGIVMVFIIYTIFKIRREQVLLKNANA